MIKCKACGYIMKEGKLGDRCPACGAPRTSFAPFVDPVGASRRRILNIDLHPIAVHFVTSFAVAALVFSLAAILLSGDARTFMVHTDKIITLLLPVLVVGTILLGILDGKVRFRKIKNSQILKKKIVLGSILFVISAGLAVAVWMNGSVTAGLSAISIALAAAATLLVYLLGLLGTSIREAIFPGN